MRNDLFPIPPAKDAHAETRRRIQEHPNFGAWYQSLSEESRTAFELLFLTDVTPELILFARQLPEAELWQPVFLRVISKGNPEPFESSLLTQHALLTVIADIEAFGRHRHPPVA
jgi:hypothetical protein